MYRFGVFVDADVSATEVFRGDAGGAGAAVRVADEIVSVARRFDNAREQGDGFLCWVSRALFRACDRDVCPCGTDAGASVLVGVDAFLAKSVLVPVFSTFRVGVFIHFFELLVAQRVEL